MKCKARDENTCKAIMVMGNKSNLRKIRVQHNTFEIKLPSHFVKIFHKPIFNTSSLCFHGISEEDYNYYAQFVIN